MVALEIIRATNLIYRHIVVCTQDDIEMIDEFHHLGCEVFILKSTGRSSIIKEANDIIGKIGPLVVLTWFFPFALNFEKKEYRIIHHVGTAAQFSFSIRFLKDLCYMLWFRGIDSEFIFVISVF